MPYVHSHGVRIHYQTEGEGAPLLLQHGFTDSLESWYERGYVPALQQHYRLILLDARGHGGSEKPHEPAAYEPHCLLPTSLPCSTILASRRPTCVQDSMGGRIGFAAAKHAPERFSSFIIGGAHPYQDNRDALAPWLQELRMGAGAIAPIRETPLSPALQARTPDQRHGGNRGLLAATNGRALALRMGYRP